MYSIIRSKSFLTIASLSLITASITACKDNDDSYDKPQLIVEEQLDSKGIMFATEGAEKQLTFTSNRKWTSAYPNWLDVSPSHGEAGTYTVRIKALNNTGAERTGNVTFKYGAESRTFVVTQSGSDNPVAPSYEGMPLSDFIHKYYSEGNETIIADNVSFQAVVISDKKSGNTQPKNANVQGLDAGIVLRFKANHKYELGSVLNIQAKGAKLQRYQGGALQLELAEDSQAVATGETREQTPIKASLKDIYDGKYENMLVELEGVQFEKANEPYLRKTQENGKEKYLSTFHALSDCMTKPSDTQMTTLSLSISSYANEFKDKVKTDKRGSIVGIVSYGTNKEKTKKYRNLIPRNFADIKLNGERCTAPADGSSSSPEDTPSVPPTGDGNGSSDTPPAPPVNGGNNDTDTPPAPAPDQGHPIITAYVEGAGSDKFIQIYNPTSKAIDLKDYTLQMENYKGSAEQAESPKMNELRLTGILEPKAVLVFKNKKADSDAYTGVAIISDAICNFNGNDNIALFWKETLIDVVGSWGSAWFVKGKSGEGFDVIFKRKSTITVGKNKFDLTEWDKDTNITAKPYSFLNARP